VGNIVAEHGVQLQYQQYADDTQLHLAMHADNAAPGLSVRIRRQVVVHAERSVTQSSHVTDLDRRNVTSAETSITSRVVCNRRWCPSTSG